MILSKPIPIPQCNRKADHHRDDDVTAHEAQMYEAATWRMYDLICRSRLIRAAHFMDQPQPQAYLVGRPSQHHVVLTQDNDLLLHCLGRNLMMRIKIERILYWNHYPCLAVRQ
ncbi:hypothetical protein QTG54_010231 [Skeletonema marinoi]|uniref:Uncharacterized protein n=1 Tax=Skeletonema marinoi TaxID=267567 RepID=A0AAD9DAQ7_9STRA|nr:hypothetical protein QTG54_010231 [Skeletonema marinoi]